MQPEPQDGPWGACRWRSGAPIYRSPNSGSGWPWPACPRYDLNQQRHKLKNPGSYGRFFFETGSRQELVRSSKRKRKIPYRKSDFSIRGVVD